MEWANVSHASSEIVLPCMREERCTAILGKEAVLDKAHQAISGLLPVSTSELPIAYWLGNGG